MKCPSCDAEVNPAAVYCPQCGVRIDQDDDLAVADRPAGPATADAPPAQDPAATEPRQRLMSAVGRGADDTEEELWEGGYSPKAMIGGWVISALVTVVLVLVGIWFATSGTWWAVIVLLALLVWAYYGLALLYRRLNVRYRLTSQRFFHEKGVLNRVTDRIEVIDMDDITFEQKLLERFVGVGTVRIVSSDRTHPELLLTGIDNVADVAAQIDKVRRAERMRRGLHIEAI